MPAASSQAAQYLSQKQTARVRRCSGGSSILLVLVGAAAERVTKKPPAGRRLVQPPRQATWPVNDHVRQLCQASSSVEAEQTKPRDPAEASSGRRGRPLDHPSRRQRRSPGAHRFRRRWNARRHPCPCLARISHTFCRAPTPVRDEWLAREADPPAWRAPPADRAASVYAPQSHGPCSRSWLPRPGSPRRRALLATASIWGGSGGSRYTSSTAFQRSTPYWPSTIIDLSQPPP